MAANLPQAPAVENVSSTLSSGITDIATTISIADATSFTSPGYYVIDRVDAAGTLKQTSLWEYIKVTNISSNDLTATRGVNGSTNQSHSSGAVIEAVVTSAHFEDWYAALNPEHTATGGHVIVGTMTVAGMQLASVATIASLGFTAGEGTRLVLTSIASIAQSQIVKSFLSNVTISNSLNASGASITGIFPSAASGAVLTSLGNATPPVFATAGVASTIAGAVIASGLDVGPTSDADSTSASFADQAGLITVLALGAHTCTVMAWLGQQVATTNVDTQVAVKIVIGASAGTEGLAKPGAVSTAGEGISAFHLATGLTGNVTVVAQIARQAGSGTARAFGSHGHLMAIAVKE